MCHHYDGGATTVWSKDDVPPARTIESDAVPAPWEGVMWGILPMATAFLAVLFFILLPDRQLAPRVVRIPSRTENDNAANDALYVREGT